MNALLLNNTVIGALARPIHRCWYRLRYYRCPNRPNFTFNMSEPSQSTLLISMWLFPIQTILWTLQFFVSVNPHVHLIWSCSFQFCVTSPLTSVVSLPFIRQLLTRPYLSVSTRTLSQLVFPLTSNPHLEKLS